MNDAKLIKPNFYWVGALDPDLKIFDIVMETKFGTSYNSYLLKGSEKVALFETVKYPFIDGFLKKIDLLLDKNSIDYLIVNHTEPDHVGSVARLLEVFPNAVVVATGQAIRFLSQITNAPFESIVAKDGMSISLGDKTIEFITVPFLHWPDTMYSYVVEDKILVTCDSFGEHYSDPCLFRSKLSDKKEEEFLESYKYYFDMIMGPFKPYVLRALERIKDLDIDLICPGHGLILDKTNKDYYIDLYKNWATPANREKPSIVIAYASAYGYTAELAHEIAKGIQSLGDAIDVLCFDIVETDFTQVLSAVKESKGFLIGSPTIIDDTVPPIWRLLTSLNPIIDQGKTAGCFGSYGWSGEAMKNISDRLKQLRYKTPLDPLKVLLKPTKYDLEAAYRFGISFANHIE